MTLILSNWITFQKNTSNIRILTKHTVFHKLKKWYKKIKLMKVLYTKKLSKKPTNVITMDET